ncbi:MAG: hypothetical protein BMS9Abin20_0769 [Acidimicrobiia bacterium]|nr:MAG: hypothetical protein BMS9Abin20_0769 [Acidimicrobiia bacterium]
MAIVLFILIAGLWAAFLLPSFFDHRSSAPKSTTRDFARTRKKLAQVSMAQPDSDAYVRKHTQYRRQRILVGLAIASVSTLVVATWTGSVPWLWVTVAFDVSIAAYVTLLLTIKQQRMMPHAQVVQISTPAPKQQPARLTAVPAPEYEESRTVRVIAG